MIKISDEIDASVLGQRRTISILNVKFPWPFPIARYLNGSSAMVFGYPVYGSKAPFYIKESYKFFSKLYKTKLWFMYRFNKKHQYHIVRTELGPAYYDVDTIMLNACMTLLCRYVEGECGGVKELNNFTQELVKPGSEGHGPREAVDHQINTQNEAMTIYHWWKVERPKDLKRRDDLLLTLYSPRSTKTKATNHPHLHEITIKEFEGDEIAMNKEFRNLERKITDDEQTMLHRLIDIRCSLWT